MTGIEKEALKKEFDAKFEGRMYRTVELVDWLIEKIDSKNAEIETLIIQLVACGVAAMANTRASVKDRLDKSNPYYTASYGDVCRAVDREIALRESVDRVKEIIEEFNH